MISKRNVRTGPSGSVRILCAVLLTGAAIAAPVTPASAAATAARPGSGQGIEDFYSAWSGRPLWFSQPGRQVDQLLQILSSAQVDGLDPAKYHVEALQRAVQSAGSGNKRATRRADFMLSQALVDYVRDLRRPGDLGIIYVDANLRPGPASPRAILDAAARAPSLERFVAELGWMHPIYGQLRHAITSDELTPQQRDLAMLNLERARELPAGNGRHIVVNAAAQRLFMYQNGQVVDSMRVVVGKQKYPTPMMTAYVRFANLNPYWYVPPDLAAERIAPNVIKQGQKYLDRQGYEVVSDFVENPTILDPSTVDWKGVADGKVNVLIRQKPGPYNSMGRIKFMFPNTQGVYLHDNPERELFEQAARLYSGGCVRLEAAWRLSHWLFGRDLTWEGAGVEEEVPLTTPVPVYITYLTAVPDGANIAFFDDVYGRDSARMAQLKTGAAVAAAK